uniref:Putative kinesin-like protein n=1 Tax=Helianthus annuus TaxID=4232 RepID=A0A251T5T9_HELAN
MEAVPVPATAPATTTDDCCVKVAVYVRPLIGDEKLQACKNCVTVVPGKPQ